MKTPKCQSVLMLTSLEKRIRSVLDNGISEYIKELGDEMVCS